MISSVGVIGSGTMGQGIAQASAMAGYDVVIYDIKPELNSAAVVAIDNSLKFLVAREKISEAKRQQTLSKITCTVSLSDVRADLVIEAVVERLDVKQQIFSQIEAANSDTSILVSNTSSLSINDIGANLKDKTRFAGLHFFNPATVMKLVEVVKGHETSSDTVAALTSFCSSLGKKAVHVADSPGFIVNRVARLYYVEALRLAEEGAADYATIDKLMRNAGFKMGPFELMDLIGIDTNLAVTKSIYKAFGNADKFRPSELQQKKVDDGDLGRKTGKGFYDY